VPGKRWKSVVDLSTETEPHPEKAPATHVKGKKNVTKVLPVSHKKKNTVELSTGAPHEPYEKKKSAEGSLLKCCVET
jgi:hypothetical protein